MATYERIQVTQGSKPQITKVLRKFWDESQAQTPQNLTGYTIKLVVKRLETDADSAAWFTLTATTVTAASGTYKFTFTTGETAVPAGEWPAEIRIWSGVTTANPDHIIPAIYDVVQAVKSLN